MNARQENRRVRLVDYFLCQAFSEKAAEKITIHQRKRKQTYRFPRR